MNSLPVSRHLLRWTSVVIAGVPTGITLAQTLNPSTQPVPVQPAASTDLRAEQKQLQAILGGDGLASPERRAQVAPQAIPVLNAILHNDDVLAHGPPPQNMTGAKQGALAMLSALGDPAAAATLQQWAESKDEQQSLAGKGGQLLSRWYIAGRDRPLQAAVAADLIQLDHAHVQDPLLTALTVRLGTTAADPALRARLLSVASDDMQNPVATEIKRQLAVAAKRRDALRSQQAALLHRPMAIKGVTPAGVPFTTADWKGKVVLVDFWAVWCVPCRAELPRVKKLYDQYHTQGLEVVGVSNDFDSDRLKTYVAQEQMPWPQLFDATAAAQHDWNPLTLSNGVQELPTMFLIDRQGICQSVTARFDLESAVPRLIATGDTPTTRPSKAPQ